MTKNNKLAIYGCSDRMDAVIVIHKNARFGQLIFGH